MKSEKIFKNEIIVFVSAMICCLLWGSAFPCIKIGYKLFEISSGDTFAQILFAGIRFFFAGLFTVILGSISERRILIPSKRSLPMIAVLALFQTVLQYIFFYMGVARTTGIKGSILNSSNVFLAILISALLLHQERISAKKLIGCALGFAGVVVINLSGFELSFNIGDMFIILSATAYAFSSAFIKKFSQSESPVMLSGYQFMLGGAFMALFGCASGGRLTVITPIGAAILAYLSMLSCIAFTLWGLLLKYNPVSKITVYGFMNPVFGVILSAIILSETGSFSAIQLMLSLALIAAGIITVNR
ncbi:MAG: DMT family transporter [Clostridia bacterium]|nr:DMT family transporter [Clostridia bacterium]